MLQGPVGYAIIGSCRFSPVKAGKRECIPIGVIQLPCNTFRFEIFPGSVVDLILFLVALVVVRRINPEELVHGAIAQYGQVKIRTRN